jgi:hypothetical protein
MLKDMAFVGHNIEYLGHDAFPWRQILAGLGSHPQRREINDDITPEEVA